MLIDSYAWIEFFLGGEKSKNVEAVLVKGDNFTSIVSIAEIVEWCLKNNKNTDYFVAIIDRYSIILNLTKYICNLSGKINFKRKKKISGWGMVDSLILTTAMVYGLQILTGDKHFSDLENVIMLR